MNSSNPVKFERARELLLRALELGSPHERSAFLAGACGGDDELRRMVEELLAYHRDDSFLERPAVTIDSGSPTATLPITEQTGDQIGRYKLLEKLGEGGFGVVYMAEQRKPVKRRVALKIIKAGLDTREVVARFEAERQALAMMDHPNIAKIHDAGATETGRPYFVMELVRGIKLTDYWRAGDVLETSSTSTPARITPRQQIRCASGAAPETGGGHDSRLMVDTIGSGWKSRLQERRKMSRGAKFVAQGFGFHHGLTLPFASLSGQLLLIRWPGRARLTANQPYPGEPGRYLYIMNCADEH